MFQISDMLLRFEITKARQETVVKNRDQFFALFDQVIFRWGIGAQTFKYSILDAVPPIHGESYHVATDKDPSMPPSWRQIPVYF